MARFQAAFFLKNRVDFLRLGGFGLLAASASSAKSRFQKRKAWLK
jgi:hypothetical protein